MPCGVYMAPSTLGEDTSMGIFTGMSLKENDVIHFPEIAVPLLFRGFDNHPEGMFIYMAHQMFLVLTLFSLFVSFLIWHFSFR